MVLSQLLTPLLTKALGAFLKPECFQEDSLQVGLWRGHVELSNVCLKEDLLDLLGLPVTLRYARIGHIEVTIPWTQLRRKSVVIKVEQVHVLAYAKYQWEVEANQRRLEAIKQAQLSAAESKAEDTSRDFGPTLKEAAAATAAAGGSTGTHWLLHRLLNQVLDLMQIEVRDVHLRFEDLTSSPSMPYCLGLSLDSFTVGSQDRSRMGHAIQAPRSFLFSGGGKQPLGGVTAGLGGSGQGSGGGDGSEVLKVAQIEYLAVYCNPVNNDDLVSMALHELEGDDEVDVMLERLLPRGPPLSHKVVRHGEEGGGETQEASSSPPPPLSPGAAARIQEQEEAAEEERRRKEEDAARFGGHRFLLHPARSTSYFWLGSQEQRSGSSQMTRVMRAFLGLESLQITLEDHLLRSMLCLSAGLIRFQTMNRLGVKRPRQSVHEDPRAWWRYVYEVVLVKLHEHRGKYDWGSVLRRRTARLQYIKWWKRWCSGRFHQDDDDDDDPSGENAAEDLSDAELQQRKEALTKKIKGLEAALSYKDILLYRMLAEAQLKEEGVTPTAEPSSGKGGWWRLLRAADSDASDPAVVSAPAYAGMVVRVELALQEGEVRLASRASNSVTGAPGKKNDFLRAVIKDLVVRTYADSVAGLQRLEVSLEDARIENHAGPAHGGGAASPTHGAAVHSPSRSPSRGPPPLSDGDKNWCRLVSRRIRPLGPTQSSHFSSNNPVLRLTYDRMPAGSPFVADVRLAVDEIEAIFVPAAPWLHTVEAFLDLPDLADSWVELEMVALSNFSGLKEQVDAKLEYIIQTHPEVRMRLDIKGPLLMILPPADEPLAPEVHLEIDTINLRTLDRDGGAYRRRVGGGGGENEYHEHAGSFDMNEPGMAAPPKEGPPPLDFNLYRSSWRSFGSLSDGSGGGQDPLLYATYQPRPGGIVTLEDKDGDNDSLPPPPPQPQPQPQGLGSSTASEVTSATTARLDLDQFYDKLQVNVLGVRVGLMPTRGHRLIPLLEPLTVMASVAVSRLPTDPQMPKLQLAASTGEINIKLSGSVLKQLTRLGVACLRQTQRTNLDFGQLRQRFETMAARGTSMTRLNSYLKFSPHLMGGSDSPGGGIILPAPRPRTGSGGSSVSARSGTGGSVFFTSPGSDYSASSPPRDFLDAHSVVSGGGSSRQSSSVHSSRRRRPRGEESVASSSNRSVRSAKTMWHGQPGLAPARSQSSSGEEDEDEDDEEFFDTMDGYPSDEDAFRQVFGSDALAFLEEEEVPGHEEEEEEEEGPSSPLAGSDNRAFASAFANVVEEVMHQHQQQQEGEAPKPTGYTYKNWRLLRVEFSLPRLQISLWGTGTSLEALEGEVDEEGEEGGAAAEALMTVWAVGFGVRYTAESYLHRVRLRLEDLTVACREAPPEMPLFRLGAPLPFPIFLPGLASTGGSSTSSGGGIMGARTQRYHSAASAFASTGSLHSMAPPLPPPPAVMGDAEGDPFQLLFQLVRDPDPSATGRMFRSLQSSIRIAAVASHIDQETVAEVLRVLAPLKTLMAMSAEGGGGGKGATTGSKAAMPPGGTSEPPSSSASSASLATASPGPVRASTTAAPATVGRRVQAPHIHLTFKAQGARVAVVRGPELAILLAIGPMAFDLKPQGGGSVLACSLSLMDLELQAVEKGTLYPHRILSHPPPPPASNGAVVEPILALTASVSTSLILPPLPSVLPNNTEQQLLVVDVRLRGLSAFVPARSMICLAQQMFQGPLVPYLVGEGGGGGAPKERTGASPPPTPPIFSRGGSEASSGGAVQGAAGGSGIGREPPQIKAALSVVQSSFWLPLQEGQHGEWQDALVLKVDELASSYVTEESAVALASLAVKGVALEQSGEEGARPILSLEAADCSVALDSEAIRVEMKLAELQGEVEAASVAFLLTLQGHVQEIVDHDVAELLAAPHAKALLGRLTPSPVRRRRQRRAQDTSMRAQSPPPSSPLASSARPVGLGLGLLKDLYVTLLGDGFNVSVGVGSSSSSGSSGGGGDAHNDSVLLLVAEDLHARLAVAKASAGSGLAVEATVGVVRFLHGAGPHGAETFVEVMGPIGGQDATEKAVWEAIHQANSASSSVNGSSSGSLPVYQGEQGVPPHLWVRASLTGTPRVAVNLGVYLYPTDWTITLPGLMATHLAVQNMTQALALVAEQRKAKGVAAVTPPRARAFNVPRFTPPRGQGGAGNLSSLLQELQQGVSADDDDVVQTKAREALGAALRTLPIALASVHLSVAIGTQQMMVLESSVAPTDMASTSPSRHRHLHEPTQALVLQAGMGLDASFVPEYVGEDVRSVTGTLKASGRGWQVTLQRLSVPHTSVPSPQHVRGSSIIVRQASGELTRLPTVLEAEQRLVSPLSWELQSGTILDLARDSQAAFLALELSLHIDPVEAWVFLDLRALQHLVSSTIQPAVALFAPPPLPRSGSAPSSPFRRRAAPATERETVDPSPSSYLVQKMPIAAVEEGFQTPAWATVAPALKPLDFVHVTATATVASARLTIINNLCRPAIPLLNATLRDVRLDVEAIDGVVDAKLTGGLRAKYFNRRLVLWEPLLEPWRAEATVMAGYLPPSIVSSCLLDASTTSAAAAARPEAPVAPSVGSPRRSPPRRTATKVVEPPPVVAAGTKGRQHFASCRLTSKQLANLNVTEDFLENVMSATLALAKAQARHKSNGGRSASSTNLAAEGEEAELHLYWIKNDTGVLLRYDPQSKDAWHEVPPGVQEPLLLPPPKERAQQQEGQGLQLVLQRTGQPAWPRLTNVNVEEEGLCQHAIHTLDGVLWVVCEVSRVAGVKLLRVRSTEILENKCSLPLRVALKAGYGVVQWEQRLAPGAQVPLPVYLTELPDATLLLSADVEAGGKDPYAVEVDMPQSLVADNDDDSTVATEGMGDSSSGGFPSAQPSLCLDLAGPEAATPLYCVMRVLRDTEGWDDDDDEAETLQRPTRGLDGGRLRTLRFSPPLVVTNVLPVSMDMVLRLVEPAVGGRSRRRQQYDADAFALPDNTAPQQVLRLRPGETYSWYGASGSQHVLMWLRLPGFEWGTAVKLRCPPTMREAGSALDRLEVELQDQLSGQVLGVSVEVTIHEAMAQQVAVFVPYWVVNTTDLPLQYAHDVIDLHDKAKLGMQDGLLAGQRHLPVRKQGDGLPVPSSAGTVFGHGPSPFSFGRLSSMGQACRGLGLSALLPPPTSEAERLLTRAKEQLVMAGYTSTASSPGVTRLRMRLQGGGPAPGPWSRGFALPPATEGLVGFFELRDHVPAAGLAARFGFSFGSKGGAAAGAGGGGKGRRRQEPRVSNLGFGLSVAQRGAGGAFHRTRVLTVAPKFLLVNAFGKPLEVKQDGTTEDSAVPAVALATTDQPTPFYWAERGGFQHLRVRLCEFGWEWSGRFVPDVGGDVTLALRHTHHEAKYLMQVRITMQGASYVIRFRREPPSFSPYRIENRTLGNVWFVQTGLDGVHSEHEPEVLLPYHACTYSWDEPLLEHTLELEWQSGEGVLRRNPLGAFSFNPDPPTRPPTKGVLVVVETRGPIRVLIITDLPPSHAALSPAAVAAEADRRKKARQRDGGLVKQGGPHLWAVDVEVELRGVGVSLLNALPQELVYVSAQNLRVTWYLYGSSSRLAMAVGHLQVDDQMIHTTCPVVFVGESSELCEAFRRASLATKEEEEGEEEVHQRPLPPVMTVSADGHVEKDDEVLALVGPQLHRKETPHIEVSVEQDLRYERILFFEAVTVRLVPYHVRVDGNLVAALLSLSSGLLSTLAEENASAPGGGGVAVPLGGPSTAPPPPSSSHTSSPVERILKDVLLRGPFAGAAARAPSAATSKRRAGGERRSTTSGPPSLVEEDAFKVFVDYLEVDLVRVQVSFTASSMVSRVLSQLVASGPGGESFRALKLLLDVVGSALSKVDNAPLRFSPLILRHAFSADLVARAVSHYTSQALRQAYVIVGTLDVLGNPAKVVANISAGLRDFIYEPAKGLRQGNLWQFSVGLYRGSASLTNRLVLSSLDGVQSLASSLHAGIMPLVGLIEDDSSTLGRRPLLLPASTSANSAVMSRRSEGSVRGLVQGVGALFLEPIRGAREGGVQGLRAGVARGIISVVLRPVRGLLEDTVDICRFGRLYLQPHLAHAERIARVRPPRLFTMRDQPLGLFSAELSLAQDVLRRLHQGAYWEEGLLFYSVEPKEEHCVLITTKHVLAVRIVGPSAVAYLLDWALPLSSLVQVETLPPASVLLHYLPSSLEDSQPTLAQTQRIQSLALTAKSSPGSPGRMRDAATQPLAPPPSRSTRMDLALQSFGGWLRHSLAAQHAGGRVSERLMELPSREAIRRFVEALRSYDSHSPSTLKILVLPYFEEGAEQHASLLS